MIGTFQLELMARIFLAAVLGVCIGFERKTHNHFAGVKTHMIVCFSSCLIMIVSKYAFADVEKYDAARLAAQAISGVGFIGAGIILKRQDMTIQGLTTAAGILGTCGVGLAIGSGMYAIGVFSTALYIFLFKVMNHIDVFHQTILASYTIKFPSAVSKETVHEICMDPKVASYQLTKDMEDLSVIKLLITFPSYDARNTWENNLLSQYEIEEFDRY